MCGIAGIVSQNWEQDKLRSSILDMTNSLGHRGPDGEGVQLINNVGLGHRRLSIIGLETGAQPMRSVTQKTWISFNGEIYNYKELRKELENRGYSFATDSDTEVILNAYEEWGVDCLTRLRGMFAFGILDTIRNEVFLARDPLGIKPLVYWKQEDSFSFASELQALRKLDSSKPDLNLKALDQYLFTTFVTGSETIYQDIEKLEPAHYMMVSMDGIIKTPPTRYWNFSFNPTNQYSLDEWAEELESLLEDSIDAHMVSDVPFGAFLSGGVDSSSIVALMSRKLGSDFKTFSIGFNSQSHDESAFSSSVAKQFNTNHFHKTVDLDGISILPDLVRHYGEPFADNSAVPTYYLCQMASEELKVVLSGDGADEIMGGYRRYFNYLEWMFYDDIRRTCAKEKKMAAFNQQFAGRSRSPSLERWQLYHTSLANPLRVGLWGEDRFSTVSRQDTFSDYFSAGDIYSPAYQAQYTDINTYLPDNILRKVDIASMMNHLEVRTPFVDVRVFEAMSRIPEQFNYRRASDATYSGKWLLKYLMRNEYSESFLSRPKMGFSVPLNDWFIDKNTIKPWVLDKLCGHESALLDIFDKKCILSILPHCQGLQLWTLLFLEEWLKQYRAS